MPHVSAPLSLKLYVSQTMKKIIIAVISICLSITLLLAYFCACEVDEEFSKRKVETHLESKGLDKINLRSDPLRTDDCKQSFVYQNGEHVIYYSVLSGGKLTYWDTQKRGPLDDV